MTTTPPTLERDVEHSIQTLAYVTVAYGRRLASVELEGSTMQFAIETSYGPVHVRSGAYAPMPLSPRTCANLRVMAELNHCTPDALVSGMLNQLAIAMADEQGEPAPAPAGDATSFEVELPPQRAEVLRVLAKIHSTTPAELLRAITIKAFESLTIVAARPGVPLEKLIEFGQAASNIRGAR